MSQFNQQFITAIIDRYGLELDDDFAERTLLLGQTRCYRERVDSIVATWLDRYDRAWIVKAIVESLHRGRYKIKSVDSILSGWQRSGQPCCKFTPEFEREILQNLPESIELGESLAPPILPPALEPIMAVPSLSSEQLNPEESAPFLHYDRGRSHSIHSFRVAADDFEGSLPDVQTKAPLADSNSSDSSTPTVPPIAARGGVDRASKNRIPPQPAKFQLFHTLRAIVEPHQPQLGDNHSPISEHLQQGEKISWNGCFGTDEFA